MEILSLTNSKLRLHSSPSDLSTVCEYSHNQRDTANTDFTLLPLPSSFMQLSKSTNNSSILNLFRLKKKDGKENFDLIQKTKGENINVIGFCKVPTKQHVNLQYSVGQVSGKIKTFDLNNKLITEFSAPSTPSSVIYLDYNATDENLASVYESGSINIYGMQTKVKLDTYNVDNQSTLARFHPTKRSHLAVASYNGGVSVIDIFAKKITFKNHEAHSAPCSDVLMSEDMLFSSGYDTTIKIFDLRQKSFGLQIKGSYGWTTLSISKCGVYFIGGNMKGEIIAYDMRDFKHPLANILVEKSNQKISRVAFLSTKENGAITPIDISKTVRESLLKLEKEIDNDSSSAEKNEFIEDIVGFQKGRISDFSSSYAPRVSISRRSSVNQQDPFSLKNIKNPFDSPVDDSRVNKVKRRSLNSSTRLSFAPHVLQEICEDFEKENNSNMINSPNLASLVPRFSSTPSITVTPTIIPNDNDSDIKEEVIEIDDSFKSVENTEAVSNDQQDGGVKKTESTLTTTATNINSDFRKELDALEKNLTEKIHFEVQTLNFDETWRCNQMIWNNIQQNIAINERMQLIEESVALLLNDDYKISRILELENENKELRRQLDDLIRRSM
ncbi:hypothetical protein PVAND_005192 [Polypedilum vanderplanki]|uniref:Uncharacterized protein n=1 Tax=Polypedilum vanderplanki TaxID=319348 RepID=A0A9J6C1C1_POLVA|nr:hypothetical protein PVAND_005192 [Polypedilum vanderplanki]